MKAYEDRSANSSDPTKIDFAVRATNGDKDIVHIRAVRPDTGEMIADGLFMSIYEDGRVVVWGGLNENLGLGNKLRVVL